VYGFKNTITCYPDIPGQGHGPEKKGNCRPVRQCFIFRKACYVLVPAVNCLGTPLIVPDAGPLLIVKLNPMEACPRFRGIEGFIHDRDVKLNKALWVLTEEMAKQSGQEPGMGIEFIDFPASGRREINEYLEGLFAKKDIEIEKRRQHPRFNAKIKVGFKSVKDFLWAYSEDISKGGIFINTTEPMPMDSEVQLKLCLPGRSKEISVVGKVIYIVKDGETERGPGMGLQLIDFEKGARKEIDDYLAELIKRDN